MPDFAREEVAVDADVLMNLVATGELDEVIKALALVLVVVPKVSAEALYLEPDAEAGPVVAIDLHPLTLSGAVTNATLAPEEIETYVALAKDVDDGEAQAIAVARSRGWRFASDDRRAGIAARRSGLVVVTTPELMADWERTSPPAGHLQAGIRAIERRARYRPGPRHPLKDWWDARSG